MGDAGHGHVVVCPVCQDEVRCAPLKWWKAECQCGYTWTVQTVAKGVRSDSIRPQMGAEYNEAVNLALARLQLALGTTGGPEYLIDLAARMIEDKNRRRGAIKQSR